MKLLRVGLISFILCVSLTMVITSLSTAQTIDADGDGVYDDHPDPRMRDNCPNQQGPLSNNGCPVDNPPPPPPSETPAPSATPTPTMPPPTPTLTVEECVVASNIDQAGYSNLRVRRAPAENAEQVAAITPYQVIRAFPDDIQNGWIGVETDGVRGYMSLDFIRMSPACDNFEVPTPTPTPDYEIIDEKCEESTLTRDDLVNLAVPLRSVYENDVDGFCEDFDFDEESDNLISGLPVETISESCPESLTQIVSDLTVMRDVNPDVYNEYMIGIESGGANICAPIWESLPRPDDEDLIIVKCFGKKSDLNKRAVSKIRELADSVGYDLTDSEACIFIPAARQLGILTPKQRSMYDYLHSTCDGKTKAYALSDVSYAYTIGADIDQIPLNTDLCTNFNTTVEPWAMTIEELRNRLHPEAQGKLRQCSRVELVYYINHVQEAGLSTDKRDRILNATNPCKAIRDFVLSGTLPAKPVISPPVSEPEPTADVETPSIIPEDTTQATPQECIFLLDLESNAQSRFKCESYRIENRVDALIFTRAGDRANKIYRNPILDANPNPIYAIAEGIEIVWSSISPTGEILVTLQKDANGNYAVHAYNTQLGREYPVAFDNSYLNNQRIIGDQIAYLTSESNGTIYVLVGIEDLSTSQKSIRVLKMPTDSMLSPTIVESTSFDDAYNPTVDINGKFLAYKSTNGKVYWADIQQLETKTEVVGGESCNQLFYGVGFNLYMICDNGTTIKRQNFNLEMSMKSLPVAVTSIDANLTEDILVTGDGNELYITGVDWSVDTPITELRRLVQIRNESNIAFRSRPLSD